MTFTAAVTAVSPGASTPTGAVTFHDGKPRMGTVHLTNGSAAFTTSSMAVRTDQIEVLSSDDPEVPIASAVIDATIGAVDDQGHRAAIPSHEASQAAPAPPVDIDAPIQ